MIVFGWAPGAQRVTVQPLRMESHHKEPMFYITLSDDGVEV